MDELHTDKEERILMLLTRIDERVLGVNNRLDILNGRVGKNEGAITDLKLTRAEQNGQLKTAGKISGAVWGIGSSVLIYAIITLLGIRK